MDKTVYMGMLFDFYGPLLTERQQEIFSLYYEDDWSLGEIATKAGVTRQAVYDILRRSSGALVQYEKRLGLLKSFHHNAKAMEQVTATLHEAASLSQNDDVKQMIDVAVEKLHTMLERG